MVIVHSFLYVYQGGYLYLSPIKSPVGCFSLAATHHHITILASNHPSHGTLFMLTPPVETRVFLTFFTAFILFDTFCGLSGWGGVG